jgi:hypothetical protein
MRRGRRRWFASGSLQGRGVTPSRGLATVIAVLLCAAPVPGDIGSCGQPIQRLDAARFFSAKKVADCRRCTECSLVSAACTAACGEDEPARSFPSGCVPLVHDGEVCLRALHYASCDDYAGYTDDYSPQVPTECNFCPRGGS